MNTKVAAKIPKRFLAKLIFSVFLKNDLYLVKLVCLILTMELGAKRTTRFAYLRYYIFEFV